MNLGTRLNNWLNVEYSPDNLWEGQIGQEEGFVHFDTVKHGLRAARIILEAYMREGYKTVESVIRRWSETDQDVYVERVCEWTGFKPEEILTLSDLNQLIRAMAREETSNTLSDDQMIAMWV